jgi:F-type H+-transporting ATPase subunit b
MKFDWWTFALQAANFLILVWLLQRFLFKPVKAIITRRKEEISHALTEASAKRESAERLRHEIEATRSQIGAERQKMIDEARAQLSAERQKMIEETRGEVEKIRGQSLKRLDEERAAASNELFERTVALATNLAERLLRELDVPSIEQPFLGRVIDYLNRLPAEERAQLISQSNASTLVVTTAHSLGLQEQSQWHEQLAKWLGPNLGIKFSADPTLIAGVEVTFPHAILRFNWRDSLAVALKELRTNGQPR